MLKRNHMFWRAASIGAIGAALHGCVVVIGSEEPEGVYWAGDHQRAGVWNDRSSLAVRVSEALSKDAELNSQNIHVHSDGDVITLKGVVASVEQLEKIIRVTRDVEGVRRIETRLAVNAG